MDFRPVQPGEAWISSPARDYMWKGGLIRESTKQGNDKVARQMEAAHRTSLAKGEERKTLPTLVEFCEKRFEPWVESTTSKKTWLDFYRVGLRAIKGCRSLASLKLDEITVRGQLNSALTVTRRVCKSARSTLRFGCCGVSSESRRSGAC
jgi:hypothetical protein